MRSSTHQNTGLSVMCVEVKDLLHAAQEASPSERVRRAYPERRSRDRGEQSTFAGNVYLCRGGPMSRPHIPCVSPTDATVLQEVLRDPVPSLTRACSFSSSAASLGSRFSVTLPAHPNPKLLSKRKPLVDLSKYRTYFAGTKGSCSRGMKADNCPTLHHHHQAGSKGRARTYRAEQLGSAGTYAGTRIPFTLSEEEGADPHPSLAPISASQLSTFLRSPRTVGCSGLVDDTPCHFASSDGVTAEATDNEMHFACFQTVRAAENRHLTRDYMIYTPTKKLPMEIQDLDEQRLALAPSAPQWILPEPAKPRERRPFQHVLQDEFQIKERCSRWMSERKREKQLCRMHATGTVRPGAPQFHPQLSTNQNTCRFTGRLGGAHGAAEGPTSKGSYHTTGVRRAVPMALLGNAKQAALVQPTRRPKRR